LTFSTVGFTGSITPPQPPAADACAPPNMTVALDATCTISFNSPVDLAALMNAVTVTMGAAATPVPFVLSSMDNLNFTVAPAAPAPGDPAVWPAGADITISMPDGVVDMNGEVLGPGPDHSVSFTTGAS
ncbi:MAG TPA: Ig-like domain-containing protein, partial [Polyangia bacterium]|nr:Ig-like domain-containing protein [Polyangia bacterium]